MSSKMETMVKKLLTVRGVHYLVTRFGPSALQRSSFDQKFLSGEWNFTEVCPELVSTVEKHAGGGDILMLGCGTGAIAQAMRRETYASFRGVDLSPAAIAIASRLANDQVHFEVGDMLTFQCPQDYNVILMSESLYYVHPLLRKKFLRNLSRRLTACGQIIVAIAQSSRYARLLGMIRRHFVVTEDRTLGAGERQLIVFR
jgi:2-polyprenyl-3-methyl-5-hydroxy-6-metoxy-1,4-benzoquinol methylase